VAPTNASFQSFITAIRVVLGDEAALDWLDGMNANSVQTFDNNLAIMDAVDTGVIDAGLVNHYYWFERAAEVGPENMKSALYYFPGGDIGSLVNVAGVGVIEGNDKAADAQALVDFLLGTQAQTYFAEQTKEYPLIEGVPPVDGLPPLSEIESPEIDLSDLNDLQGTLDLLAEVGLT
jgi:iron(III) transport system substrate-binding protein